MPRCMPVRDPFHTVAAPLPHGCRPASELMDEEHGPTNLAEHERMCLLPSGAQLRFTCACLD